MHFSIIEKGAFAVLVTAWVVWGSNFIVDARTDCPLEDKATVRIVADASQAALTDIFGFFTGKTLSVEVSMRKEDPCV